MRQVGNTLGVAVTGAIFVAFLDGDYDQALGYAATELAVVLVAAAALTRLLRP